MHEYSIVALFQCKDIMVILNYVFLLLKLIETEACNQTSNNKFVSGNSDGSRVMDNISRLK